MAELRLEDELRALGRELVVPVAPDLVPSVLARLEALPARAPVTAWRRPLLIAGVALVLAIAAAFAVPAARTAILEFFHLRGATIERVQTLPPVRVAAELDLGERVTLEEARNRAGFTLLVPTEAGLEEPDEVYFDGSVPDGHVFLVYGARSHPRLLLSEFRGTTDYDLIEKKAAGPGTSIEPVSVAGEPGFWLSGEPHVVYYVDAEQRILEDTVRLAGNVLIWQHGDLTLRLEAAVTKVRALEIAGTLE